MSVLANLVVKMSADTAALERGMKGAQGHMSKLGGIMKTGALAGGAALAGLGVASLKMGMDFEKTMAEVKTLMPDISEKAFGKMRDDVLAFSKEMGIATDKAVPALYQAISAGVPRENVMEFMTVASKAAIGGVTELETAVDGITSVVNAYGVANISAQKAADIMFTGVRLGKTTFDELSASLFNVVPMAAAAGISFEEIVAALARLTAQGVPTAQATTQLREAIKALAAPTQEQAKLMAQLGLDFSASRLESIGLVGAFDELYTATGGNLEQMRKLTGSSEALMAILGLSGEQAGAFSEAIAEAERAAGGLDAAFETVSATTAFKLNKAINALKVEMTKLGAEVLPVLVEAIEDLQASLDNLEPLVAEVARHTELLSEGLEDLQGDVSGLGEAFSKLEGDTKVWIDVAIAALKLGASPLVLGFVVIREIMGLVAALFRGDWSDALNHFKDLALSPLRVAWWALGDVVSTVMISMGRAVEAGVNAIISVLNKFIGALNTAGSWVNKFTGLLGDVGDWLEIGTIPAIEKVNLRLEDFESMLRGSTEAVQTFGQASAILDPTMETFRSRFQQAADAAAGLDGLGPALEDAAGAAGGLGGAAEEVAEELGELVEEAINPVTAALDAMVDSIRTAEGAISGLLSVQTQEEAQLQSKISLIDLEIERIDQLAGEVRGLSGLEETLLRNAESRLPRSREELEILNALIEAYATRREEGEKLEWSEKKEEKAAKERIATLEEQIAKDEERIEKLRDLAERETAAGRAARESVEDYEAKRDALKDDLDLLEAGKKAQGDWIAAQDKSRPTIDELTATVYSQAFQIGILEGAILDVPPALRGWVDANRDLIWDVAIGMSHLLLAQKGFVTTSKGLTSEWALDWEVAAAAVSAAMAATAAAANGGVNAASGSLASTAALAAPVAAPVAAAGVSGGGTTVIHHHIEPHFDGPMLGDRRQSEEILRLMDPALRQRVK